MLAARQRTKIRPLIVNRFWRTDYEPSATYSKYLRYKDEGSLEQSIAKQSDCTRNYSESGIARKYVKSQWRRPVR
jgi:hypothetical protein